MPVITLTNDVQMHNSNLCFLPNTNDVIAEFGPVANKEYTATQDCYIIGAVNVYYASGIEFTINSVAIPCTNIGRNNTQYHICIPLRKGDVIHLKTGGEGNSRVHYKVFGIK